MQRPVNKNAGRSRAQCVQGRVEQRRREKGQRLGNASTRKQATSVAGTIDRTARRRESRRDRTRLSRAGEPGHPGSPGLTAQRASTARSATHIVGEMPPPPPPKKTTRVQLLVQPGGDPATTHKRLGSKQETRERDRETARFHDSLTYSRVSGASPGKTKDGPGKEEEDGHDREQGETYGRSGFPQTWTEPNSRPQGQTVAKGKGASEEPVETLTGARKSVQETSGTESGPYLPVPPCYGTPG